MRHVLAMMFWVCASGTVAGETVGDLKAFHAAWVIAQTGKSLGDPAMIVGSLEIFSHIAPRARTKKNTTLRPAYDLPTAWNMHIETLAAEARFLERDSPMTLPDRTPDRFLPADVFTVAPGQELEFNVSGLGSWAVLSLESVHLEIQFLDALGQNLCATTGASLYCPMSNIPTVQAVFSNPGDMEARIILLGETH